MKTSLRDGFRELCIGLYIEVVFHNLFLVSIKCPRRVTRFTPAGNESRAKLGTEPAWNSAAASLPKADRRLCNPFLQALSTGLTFGM